MKEARILAGNSSNGNLLLSNLVRPFGGPTPVLNDKQWQQLNELVATLSSEQVSWVSGYLAGVTQSTPAVGANQQSAQAPSNITILYGSQTGNAKGVAEEFKQAAEAQGLPVKVVNMADFKPKSLKNESLLVVVASTHGEGEPPDDAIELHGFLGSKKAAKLEGLQYAVLGLGDTSYEFFCQTAKDFDTRLAALGAKSMMNRVDCDVDYDQSVTAWSSELIEKLKLISSVNTQAVSTASAGGKVSSSNYTKNQVQIV